MKYKFFSDKHVLLFLVLWFTSCTTTQNSGCQCPSNTNQTSSTYQNGQYTQNLTPEQAMELASQLFRDGAYDEAFNVLNTIPNNARGNQYQKLRQDVINKIVMNMRYKVRVLYEKAVLQEGRAKKDLLLQCKQTLESIIKNYPEYTDMYAVKNNLKQVERALGKKT